MGSGLRENGDPLKSADRREALVALQYLLAEKLRESPDGLIAQLSAQLRACTRELAELPASEKVSPIDLLNERRARRLSTPNAATSP